MDRPHSAGVAVLGRAARADLAFDGFGISKVRKKDGRTRQKYWETAEF